MIQEKINCLCFIVVKGKEKWKLKYMIKILIDVDAVKFYGKLRIFHTQTELCSPFDKTFSSETFRMLTWTFDFHWKHQQSIKNFVNVFRKHQNCFKKALIIFKKIQILLFHKTIIFLPSKHPYSLHNNRAKEYQIKTFLLIRHNKKKSSKKSWKFSCVTWDIHLTYFKHFSDSDDMTIK